MKSIVMVEIFYLLDLKGSINMSSRQQRIAAENKAKFMERLAWFFLLLIAFMMGVVVGDLLL